MTSTMIVMNSMNLVVTGPSKVLHVDIQGIKRKTELGAFNLLNMLFSMKLSPPDPPQHPNLFQNPFVP